MTLEERREADRRREIRERAAARAAKAREKAEAEEAAKREEREREEQMEREVERQLQEEARAEAEAQDAVRRAEEAQREEARKKEEEERARVDEERRRAVEEEDLRAAEQERAERKERLRREDEERREAEEREREELQLRKAREDEQRRVQQEEEAARQAALERAQRAKDEQDEKQREEARKRQEERDEARRLEEEIEREIEEQMMRDMLGTGAKASSHNVVPEASKPARPLTIAAGPAGGGLGGAHRRESVSSDTASETSVGGGGERGSRVPSNLEEQKRLARERGKLKALQRAGTAQKVGAEALSGSALGAGVASKPSLKKETAVDTASMAGGVAAWDSEAVERQKEAARERGRLMALERAKEKHKQAEIERVEREKQEARKKEAEEARLREEDEWRQQEAAKRERLLAMQREKETLELMIRQKKELEEAAALAARNERQVEGDKFLTGADQAIDKGMFTTAQTLIVAAAEMYGQAGLSEEACELKVLGMHQKLKRVAAEEKRRQEEEAARIRAEEEARIRREAQEAKERQEKEEQRRKEEAERMMFVHAENGGYKQIESLLASGLVQPDLINEDEDTPLAIACQNDKKKVVKVLMRHGADINHQNAEGRTPLHLCADAGNEELCEYIQTKGANPNIKDVTGRNAAEYARYMAGEREPTPPPTPKPNPVHDSFDQIKLNLFKAAEANDAEEVKDIFARGLHPDATDKFGNTVLVIAATVGSLEVCKEAVAAKCDVNKPSSKGDTPLLLARNGLTHALVRGGDKHVHGSVVDFLEGVGAKASVEEAERSNSEADNESVAATELPANPRAKKKSDKARPKSADMFRGGFGGVNDGERPVTASARLATAMGAMGKVFSVFEKRGSTAEVLRLEDDVKGADRAVKEIQKAESKAMVHAAKAEKAHKELMARAEAAAPKIERIKAEMHALSSFDDGRAVLVEAKAVEKEALLSREALDNMGWPFEELEGLQMTLKAEADLKSILREHRMMAGEYDEEKEYNVMRARITDGVAVLEPLEESDSYLLGVARELGLALDGEGDDNLVSRCEAAIAEWTQMLLVGALARESKISSKKRNKRAIKKDVQLAYDSLDKSLDTAELVMERLKINVQTEEYNEAQDKLQLLSAEHQAILF